MTEHAPLAGLIAALESRYADQEARIELLLSLGAERSSPTTPALLARIREAVREERLVVAGGLTSDGAWTEYLQACAALDALLGNGGGG